VACGLLAAVPSQAGEPPADLQFVQLATGLSRPVAVRHAGDGSDRIFIIEKLGRIRIFDLSSNTLLATPFLDIDPAVDSSGNEQGLLGLAFHPNYASNGFFYVNYTTDPGAGLDRTRIERYSVSADPNVADDTSGVVLLEIEQDASNHNGGDIHFGPDGFLYIGMGDGGGANDTANNAQTRLELLGKMLRIDVDGASAPEDRRPRASAPLVGAEACGLVGNYVIPASNPFVGVDGTCDEIWAIGLRNPYRFSFDRGTGDMFIADVGQGAIEEIDFQPAASSGGENWGWRCYEGNNQFNTTGCLPIENYDFPILQYSHSGGNCSVTGGFRYRGSIPGFFGTYVYADYCSGTVWFADNDTGPWVTEIWTTSGALQFGITSFGEDEAGELYFVHDDGELYRFESPSSQVVFGDGFESGDTDGWSDTVPLPTL
jgi:glucose/arabinose dehydrogenase